MENGTLDKSCFEWYKWNDLQKLIEDPVLYHTNKMLEMGQGKKGQLAAQNSIPSKIIQKFTYIPRKIYGGYRCYKEHGIFYTLKRIYQKVVRRIGK